MAWTQVGATPGTPVTYYYSPSTQYADYQAFYFSAGDAIAGVDLTQLQNPLYGIPFAGDPSGDLTFTGGGGSTRPSSGFLYPRGY